MAYVVIQKPPSFVTREMVEAVGKHLDAESNPPPGLIVHTAVESPDGLQIIDVWDSKEAHQKFRSERLEPTIEKATGMNPREGEQPQIEYLEVFDLVRGK